MIVDTKRLVKISTYAKEKNVSTTWVRKLIDDKELKLVIIDGMKFVLKE